jgi:hypothetical protein
MSATITFDESNLGKELGLFVRALYNGGTILSVEANGLTYRQRTSEWSHGSGGNRLAHDPDVICNGYFDCELPPPIEVDGGDITYNMELGGFDDVVSYEDEEDENEYGCITALERISDPKKTIFHQFNRVTVRNTSGFNDDHRGSDHCAIKLDFWDSYEINGPVITVYDLLVALYKVKSHKWDIWYEMFSNVDSHSLENGHLTIEVSFDHGS